MTERHSGEQKQHSVAVFADPKAKVEPPDQAAATAIPVRVVDNDDNDERHSRRLPAAVPIVAADKALWLNIVRFLPSADLQTTIRTMPELGGMAELVEAEQRTRRVLTYIKKRGAMKGCEVGGSGTPNDSNNDSDKDEDDGCVTPDPVSRLDVCVDIDGAIRQIEHRTEFWECWTASALTRVAGKHGGFGSLERFHEFCGRAGIHPSDGVRWCHRKGLGESGESDTEHNTERNRRSFGDHQHEHHRHRHQRQRQHRHHASRPGASVTAWIEKRLFRAYFLSADKQLVLVCKNDPRDNPDFYSIYPRSADTIRCCGDSMIMVLGRRDRVSRLEQWLAAATGTTVTTTATTGCGGWRSGSSARSTGSSGLEFSQL
uniref:Uncharacterized protein n=1 Tax=Pseudo-nitzschia australis TaxID=44445 RepID=A0A7S4ADQ7_9STRA|mmetsp:Transcript_3356/g.7306  ORF Transcript_3356/g.7306 Transcript_3356/m.7306 type:complete len:373 (-) Transcript_3356:397-1515(-)|eukprot:CAMPEP_0168165578 /NCGR_PEP_ID=MMETSP0139_2-20121125/1563_1 /TAXON_ID=44445 /ORGANISM="Pseudo-nitzschia australis, Strain 10249 10 AB" /LENGTH=372 /DNA_ID=CAMNT_0008082707 /DNA_START=164 /DNA_END=1282 /DNA_ORIENTATION=+